MFTLDDSEKVFRCGTQDYGVRHRNVPYSCDADRVMAPRLVLSLPPVRRVVLPSEYVGLAVLDRTIGRKHASFHDTRCLIECLIGFGRGTAQSRKWCEPIYPVLVYTKHSDSGVDRLDIVHHGSLPATSGLGPC